MLHENVDFIWILLAIAGFFLGTFNGIKSEARYWIKRASEGKPVIKNGLIFEVKCVGEEYVEN